MGFGREDAICEQDIAMQILPGSSDDAVLIDVSRRLCNGSKASANGGIRRNELHFESVEGEQ
jgi:hypothetical protein